MRFTRTIKMGAIAATLAGGLATSISAAGAQGNFEEVDPDRIDSACEAVGGTIQDVYGGDKACFGPDGNIIFFCDAGDEDGLVVYECKIWMVVGDPSRVDIPRLSEEILVPTGPGTVVHRPNTVGHSGSFR